MNNRKTKFLQPLKSIMDFQGLQQMQAAVNSLLNGKMTNGQVIYSDSNVVWDNKSSSQTFETILPFTIYNIENNGSPAVADSGAGYVSGDFVELVGGVLASGSATKYQVWVNPTGGIVALQRVITGNYSTQPTFPNSVTGGSGSGAMIVEPSTADNWRTFQIRDGLVSWRPKFPNFYTDNIPYNFPYSIQADSSYDSAPRANYEYILQVFSDYNTLNLGSEITDSPFIQPRKCADYTTSVVLSRTQPTLIYGWETITANHANELTSFGQILLDDFATIPPGDVLNPQPLACFWLEVIDDPLKGLYVNLWGRMTGGSPGFPNTSPESFPVGKNIIQLGFCAPQVTGQGIGSGAYPIYPLKTTLYIQLQCGNVVNRYPQAGGGLYKNYRGAWTADSLSGQLFYIGDEVIDDTAQVPYFIGYTGAVAPPDPGDIAIYAYAIYTYIGPFTIPPTLNGFNIETDPPSANSTNAWIQTGWTPVIPNALPI